MTRPIIPAAGDATWGEPSLRQAIFAVSDRVDSIQDNGTGALGFRLFKGTFAEADADGAQPGDVLFYVAP